MSFINWSTLSQRYPSYVQNFLAPGQESLAANVGSKSAPNRLPSKQIAGADDVGLQRLIVHSFAESAVDAADSKCTRAEAHLSHSNRIHRELVAP